MLSSLFRTCQRQPVRGRLCFGSSLRHYATAPPKRVPPTRAAAPKSAPASIASRPRPTAANLNDLYKLRRVELAEQLYNSGTTLLYNAGGRLRAYRAQCYCLSVICFAAIYLNIPDLSFLSPEELRKRGIPPYLAVVYAALGFFLILAGNWTLYRAQGQIRRITLVKQLDNVFLEVTATRRIPFRSHRVLVRPYDMVVDPGVVRMNRVPRWMRARQLDESSPSATTTSVLQNTARAFSRFFFHIFSAARQFFEREGVISTTLLHPDNKSTPERLDLDLGGDYHMRKGPQQDPEIEVLFDLTTFQHANQPDVD